MTNRFFGKALMAMMPLLILGGCASTEPQKVFIPPPPITAPAFPPQKVMESGDYAGFIAENQKVLKDASEDGAKEIALFNLGFCHCYSKSPYFNQAKAIRYFEQLIEKYPSSPMTYQAKAWIDLMKKQIVAETKRRRISGQLKAKETAIKNIETAIQDKETAIKDKETAIKDKETTIIELQERMKRSREIDEEIEQKERELLQ